MDVNQSIGSFLMSTDEKIRQEQSSNRIASTDDGNCSPFLFLQRLAPPPPSARAAVLQRRAVEGPGVPSSTPAHELVDTGNAPLSAGLGRRLPAPATALEDVVGNGAGSSAAAVAAPAPPPRGWAPPVRRVSTPAVAAPPASPSASRPWRRLPNRRDRRKSWRPGRCPSLRRKLP
jgi:hypothetical protein